MRHSVRNGRPWGTIVGMTLLASTAILYPLWRILGDRPTPVDAAQLTQRELIVYGPATPPVQGVVHGARLRGLRVRHHRIDSHRDFTPELVARFEEAGLMHGEMVYFPVGQLGDTLLDEGSLRASLNQIPLPPARPGPYIHVYGPRHCSRTRDLMADLDARGLPYEYRDINARQWRPEAEARLDAAGLARFSTPVVDVSGTMLSGPGAAAVARQYGD